MTKLGSLNILIGALLPLIIAIVVQAKLPRWANMILTILICAGVGTLTVYISDAGLHWISFNATNVLITLATIFAASQAVYAAYWNKSPVMAKVNEVTNV